MSPEEVESGRAALREVIEALAAAMPPLSPEDEACIQLSMRRDELLRARWAARLTQDDAAIAAAEQALVEIDAEYAALVSRHKARGTP